MQVYRKIVSCSSKNIAWIAMVMSNLQLDYILSYSLSYLYTLSYSSLDLCIMHAVHTATLDVIA